MKPYGWVVLIFLILNNVACTSADSYAPVNEINGIQPATRLLPHVVEKYETIYSVAWRYGLDFRYLAYINQLKPPYELRVGTVLYLEKPITPAKKQKLQAFLQKHNVKQQQNHWLWPTQGTVVNAYSRFNKGVNIGGHLGEPISAVANGRVVYSGNGLRGYGNLIILKHDDLYLTAYAHNRVNRVKEGERVTRGQVIAEMGHTGTNRTMLHFEIRRAGKPVDPIAFYRKKVEVKGTGKG